jgi:hypothetical protein
MAKYADKSLEDVFRLFRLSDYFDIMAVVIEKMQQAVVCAKVPPHEGCDGPEEISRRQSLLKMMNPSLFLSVESEVMRKWKVNREAQSGVVQASS